MMARIKKKKQDELDAEDFSLYRPPINMSRKYAEPVLDDYITEVMMMLMMTIMFI
jgi:hypothetical protein